MTGEIGLATLGGGVALEKFKDEFQRVVENILDPNTGATVTRSVTITVTIKPTVDRLVGAISVSASSKLAASASYGTRAYFGKDGDRALAFEDDPKQVTITDFLESAKDKVAQLEVAK
jgi:hypothetical protein